MVNAKLAGLSDFYATGKIADQIEVYIDHLVKNVYTVTGNNCGCIPGYFMNVRGQHT
jgi:hypothetical protein